MGRRERYEEAVRFQVVEEVVLVVDRVLAAADIDPGVFVEACCQDSGARW
jgi:hypothetical protein